MRLPMRFIAIFMALAAVAPAAGQNDPQATTRRDAFRAFAQPLVGDWSCRIEEWGPDGKLVWSDVQKRVFSLTMARHYLEERALLKTPDGREYEGGVHLLTYDPNSERLVQHGFWLPQPDRLFVVDGRISGGSFEGLMTIRNDKGGEDIRPYRLSPAANGGWTIEVRDKRADGSAYVRERLVYSRLAQSQDKPAG